MSTTFRDRRVQLDLGRDLSSTTRTAPISPARPAIAANGRLRRSWVQRSILAINVVLIAASLLAASVLNYGYQRTAEINRVALARNLTALPPGQEPGSRVLNILLVGSDSSAGLDVNDPVQVGREGERFGDVIIVAHVDERTRDVALLSFPRDLWVPIAGTSSSDRINRAFVIGGPGALIDTLEAEFGIPINHYVNVDFAGFQGLVDAVGSVAVPFPEPARDWNVAAKPRPRSQTGFVVEAAGCHALDGPTALAYVRSRFYQTQNEDGRWVTDPTSDFGRIQRQQDFLRRLAQAAIDRGARNPFVLNNLLDAALANVAIDEQLTPQVILDLALAFRTFEPGDLESFSIPVVDAEVNGNQVLKEVSLESEPVLNLFRGASIDDPSTVVVSIVTRRGASSETDDFVDRLGSSLEQDGFAFRTEQRNTVAEGVTIVHGPRGQGAFEVVAPVVAEVSGGPTPTGTPGVGLHSRAVEITVDLPPATLDKQTHLGFDAAGGSATTPTTAVVSDSAFLEDAGLGESAQPALGGGGESPPREQSVEESIEDGAAVQSGRSNDRDLRC